MSIESNTIPGEVVPDGYLEIRFLETSMLCFNFEEIKGWRLEHGWLRVFLNTRNISWPFHRIDTVTVVYNSAEVQEAIDASRKGKGPTDTFSCNKCGGEIK